MALPKVPNVLLRWKSEVRIFRRGRQLISRSPPASVEVLPWLDLTGHLTGASPYGQLLVAILQFKQRCTVLTVLRRRGKVLYSVPRSSHGDGLLVRFVRNQKARLAGVCRSRHHNDGAGGTKTGRLLVAMSEFASLAP